MGYKNKISIDDQNERYISQQSITSVVYSFLLHSQAAFCLTKNAGLNRLRIDLKLLLLLLLLCFVILQVNCISEHSFNQFNSFQVSLLNQVSLLP